MFNISPRVFAAMKNLDIAALATYPQSEIRPVLPSLVRMSLLSPLDNTESSIDSRKQILAVLIEAEVVNNIVSYLQVNYHELEQELKKEIQSRQKSSLYDGQTNDFGLQTGIALGFERSDVTRKVRVVLSEIFNIQWQLVEEKNFLHSEIFDDSIYLEDVVDILCIALAELPTLLNILELVDSLVNVYNGERIICALIANFPDYYQDVISHVIVNCDEETNEGRLKLSLLMALSKINPRQSLATRFICAEQLKVPSFMLKLCLEYPSDTIAFLTGLLLGNDQNVRSWFAVYIRSSQKRKSDALNLVRAELLNQLQKLIIMSKTSNEDYTTQGAVIIRLYCALRGIAGLKFNDDEVNALSQLVTSRPAPTHSGLRFVALALCMVIACPSLVATTALENKFIEWLQWIIKEDAFYGKKWDTTTSLGEMLLLLAIHFHSNQISAITDLVCATLAMKIPIRPNNTNRIKQVFTQDLFTEQVIASHAIRIPVTPNLNANLPGYLSVPCIHQLLKSRAFLKHKVPIKSWIYKQICNSIRPLHPVMPALIEVYVQSLIVPNPSGRPNLEHMHKPFLEEEIIQIFKNSHNMEFKSSKIFHDFPIPAKKPRVSGDEAIIQCPLTAQLLILYYLVLYEDVRVANLNNASAINRKEYTNGFISGLPIKYLLQKAQQHQNDYVGLFHPLLRLIISNYPHLSLVEDWLDEHYISSAATKNSLTCQLVDSALIRKAFDKLNTHPIIAIRAFRCLLKLPCELLAQHFEVIVDNLPNVFQRNTPRILQELYIDIWLKLNLTLPINFWKMSLHALLPDGNIANSHIFSNDSIMDPLEVFRCNESIDRSPYILTILLRILQGYLAASKAYLNVHIQSKQVLDKTGQIQTEGDREELKTALIASQESAAVHILLEILSDMHKNANDSVSLLALRETQGIICSFIHQTFISEPSLAKLVHFQTYPREVIPMMVAGVPSMHICIDFLHEFLSMPEMDKQIFTIDLTSHLVLKYAIPKSLNISKFCIITIQTALSLLSTSAKCKFLCETLPALIRFVEAFPILVEDCINILIALGRNVYSQGTLGITTTQMQLNSNTKLKSFKNSQHYINMIERAFKVLINRIIHKVELY